MTVAADRTGKRGAPAEPMPPSRLVREFTDGVTDKFLEALLEAMNVAFALSPGYRRNIEGYRGRLLFRTADGAVEASAVFEDGDLHTHGHPIGDWDVRVTFRDAAGLRAFLFSKDRDILDSILRNDVEVDGNLNHLYRFGFLARELARKLGIG